jgi:thiamine-monophosphate kinase
MSESSLRLIDVGERGLIADYLRPRYGPYGQWRFGDDCAVMLDTRLTGAGYVVATTDPAPKPVAWELGYADYFHWGWLLAAINWSDIAAAGAEPIGLLTSLTLPNEMLVSDFERLLDGIDSCCSYVGSHVKGGNLRERHEVNCEAMALGIVRHGNPLSRAGARPGDAILSLGTMGYFWSAVLSLQQGVDIGHEDPTMEDILLRPRPLVEVGASLRAAGVLSACTDNSDGIYGSLRALSQASPGIGFQVECDAIEFSDLVTRTGRRLGVEPLRLGLGFGDLQLISTVEAAKVREVEAICRLHNVAVARIGTVVARPGIWLRSADLDGRMTDFDNERFTFGSQFTGGLAAYCDRLLKQPLVAE